MAACAACAALPLCMICTWGMHGPVFRSLRSERKHAPCTIRCRMRQLNSVFIQKRDCWQPQRRTRASMIAGSPNVERAQASWCKQSLMLAPCPICLYPVATKLPPIPATPPTLPTQPSCLPPHSASHPCTAAPPPSGFGWQGSGFRYSPATSRLGGRSRREEGNPARAGRAGERAGERAYMER